MGKRCCDVGSAMSLGKCDLVCLNNTATTENYTYRHTLALHDALPICDRLPRPDIRPRLGDAVPHAAARIAHPKAGRRAIACRTHRHRFETVGALRSEEHTSELQSLMRHSYAVFCLQQKN